MLLHKQPQKRMISFLTPFLPFLKDKYCSKTVTLYCSARSLTNQPQFQDIDAGILTRASWYTTGSTCLASYFQQSDFDFPQSLPRTLPKKFTTSPSVFCNLTVSFAIRATKVDSQCHHAHVLVVLLLFEKWLQLSSC